MAKANPIIEGVPGFKAAGVHAGLKADGALDFAIITSDRPCMAAGVFTTNQVKAAPVLVDMERLQRNPENIRAVVINTKCANACTGQPGIENALLTARWAAEALSIAEDEVLVMSTGVIGTQLPMDKIRRGIELAVDSLGDSPAHWEAAAKAIMTTDTRHKLAAITNYPYARFVGMAKGAGMIAPNMATMLSVIATDGAFSNAAHLQTILRRVNQTTFNRIVIDGDTSTNDTVLLLANGASGEDLSEMHASEDDPLPPLTAVCETLAKAVVRDGEGVTKFITVNVYDAPDEQAAHQIANTISASPLVKTAFYGNDANWGRIMAAAGRSGVPFQPERVNLWITPGEHYGASWNNQSIQLLQNGVPTNYDEARATEIISQAEVSIHLSLGAGDGEATVWTCDLSHDYVSINGHYRT